MFLTLSSVLNARDLARVLKKTGDLDWQDGARTAGGRARAVKRNLQANLRSGPGAALHDFLMTTLSAHPVLVAAAQPARFSRLMLSKTGPDGRYGRHVDNPLMGEGPDRLRTDLSFTLFLSDPATYDGGDLVVEGVSGNHSAKPAAGDLVLYPSGDIHEVKPVTRGERLACVGWIESRVRDAQARTTLFELENIRASLGAKLPPDAPDHLALDKVISNLVRRWSAG
ncbi:Fe2+-dependent dioxygenase [Hyphomonas johnsonii]|uniref:2OG-Fe(II) oxygenase n=1 Tax=Hyphomonas johnsonii MHS-2 TaxID=1280950 RepID=A0A059FNE5_9PROT|nr:Fe2+-dependent dioxygenase [Hyphomonas johnsonii]KCZ92164.1 2OG-Fe(II) oxygenase [Hyphomonas johnsonii MHS-2]